jgi:hypothetical protein
MPNSPWFLQQNVMDYGCFHQRYELWCFFVNNLPKKQRTHMLFFGIGATLIKTAVDPSHLVFLTLNTPLFWWNRIYCNCSLDCYHF